MKGGLCIDIGNSSVKVAFYHNGNVKYERISADRGLEIKAIREIIGRVVAGNQVKGAIVSSVVKELTDRVVSAVELEASVQAIVLDHRVDTGLKINVLRPELLGPDRLANAVAAYELYRENVIAVDFGTATTTTVVTEKAELIGGHIMPGVSTMLESLANRTSRLPMLRPEKPELPFGNDTKSSIMSGVIYGTAGAVSRFIKETEAEIGKCNVIVTGGMSEIVNGYLDFPYTYVPMLTMKGLIKILNRSLS